MKKKIVLATDSFKGTLSSMEIIDELEKSIRKNWGEQEIVKVPVADGGEGTMEALVAATGGEYRQADVTDSYGNVRNVNYGVIHGDMAVIEMAAIEGLGMLDAGKLDPLEASSGSLGEMIVRVLDDGFRKIMIGIGGSASNDGGMGLLRALGVGFTGGGKELYGRGRELEKVESIDISGLDKRLKETEISVICDVTNPLLGPNGATYIYGKQKGAVGEIADRLEKGMENYAQRFSGLGVDIVTMRGAGAAGGVGAALGCVLGASLKRGIDAVLDIVRFDELIEGADLVVTGEGRLDSQSVKFGKVPVGVAKRCSVKKIPVAILAGSVGDGWQDVFQVANCSVMTTVDAPMTLEEALANAQSLLRDAADRMFRFIGLMSSDNK